MLSDDFQYGHQYFQIEFIMQDDKWIYISIWHDIAVQPIFFWIQKSIRFHLS